MDWFPLYVKDIMMSRKVSKMSNEEFGIYMKLLCHQWLDGPLPKDMEELANMCGCVVGAMVTAWEHLGLCFKEYKEGYLNTFLEEVRIEQKNRSEKASRAGRMGAEAMWAKKREAGKRNAEAMPPLSRTNGNLMPVEKRREDKIKVVKEAIKVEGALCPVCKEWCAEILEPMKGGIPALIKCQKCGYTNETP